VRSPIRMLFGIVALGVGLSATGVVYAASTATGNKCWGLATKEFQALGEPGLGEHASSFNTPREGVGNVTKQEHGDLSEGGQGIHAANVAPTTSVLSTLPQECQELRTAPMP
jgi:hypothetical protein